MPQNTLPATFLGSFPSVTDCPTINLPEHAFVGRSNVGKSSLINAMLDKKSLSKVSATPGKTRLINLFNIDKKWVVADLPGYGYAKLSQSIKSSFNDMIQNYLFNRLALANSYLLIDSNLAPQKNDLAFIHLLGSNSVPFTIVFTKCDRLSKSRLHTNVETYKHKLLETWEVIPEIIITSSVSKSGCDALIKKISSINNFVHNKNM